MTKLQEELFSMQDKEYQLFQQKLMPTVPAEQVIGIRTPLLRKFAKTFAKDPGKDAFLADLPHAYYEENNLHAFLLEQEKEYDKVITEIEEFLPYIDNWATCDSFTPKVFEKHLKEVYEKIKCWIKSDRTYTIRYGVGLLQRFFLEDAFKREMVVLVANIVSEEYYVNMMCAWYMATALAKQKETVLPFFLEHKMQEEVWKKAVQKAIESFRIDEETKEELRVLRKANK